MCKACAIKADLVHLPSASEAGPEFFGRGNVNDIDFAVADEAGGGERHSQQRVTVAASLAAAQTMISAQATATSTSLTPSSRADRI